MTGRIYGMRTFIKWLEENAEEEWDFTWDGPNANPGLPNWLGTPKPHPPTAPAHFDQSYMNMHPARAQDRVSNALNKQGIDPHQAAKYGHDVARHVDDYSTHPENVYQRVMRNVYNQTGDMQRAIQVAKQAAVRAKQFNQQ